MCATCGCSDNATLTDHTHTHDHAHDHVVPLEQRVLARNDEVAARNRTWFTEHGVLAVNLMSSPGSGKTTLLTRTITRLRDRLPVSVVEGDQETDVDADRIRATGRPVVQVNTGTGCHLDATMVDSAVRTLAPVDRSVVFVENVGNLVCPALFDLGESARVVIMSVTEGADKPLKYPHMFRTADLVVLNKIDLLPYVDFDPTAFAAHLARVLPDPNVIPVSATRGDGMADWIQWIEQRIH
ncbi:MAG TPA: hydrogenase nickel incorporation protein HypB [Pseudonocardiaceae bacterium]|nr:hydrogenase nickel incorporation protein HypB [Pseudonocardiaceae bacterium]